MHGALELLRSDRRVRFFFCALTQSALGTGAGYVALLLIAYDRFHSAWAISLVLAADLLPTMLFGPLFGAVADRSSKKTCAVVADVVRAVAFGGIVLVDNFAVTVAFAVMAGVGTGLFRPATLAAVPSLVDRSRVSAATAMFGAVEDVGFTLGPALAGAAFLAVGATDVLALNSVTFAASALILLTIRFGSPPVLEDAGPPTTARPSLIVEARAGLAVAASTPGLRAVLLLSSATLLFCGLFNVGELLFVKSELDAGPSAFSWLVMLFGLGFLGGSLAGARGGALADLKRAYLSGLAVLAAGFIGSALAPSVGVAALTFLAAGFGNGLILVHERLIIQAVISERMIARIYGVKDALTAWAFGLAFASGGILFEIFGVRPVLLAAGLASALIAGAGALLLATAWSGPTTVAEKGPASVSVSGFDLARQRPPRQNRADLVAAGDGWLALLDDLDESVDH